VAGIKAHADSHPVNHWSWARSSTNGAKYYWTSPMLISLAIKFKHLVACSQIW